MTASRTSMLRMPVLFVLLLVAAAPLSAQRGQGRGAPQDRTELERRVRARFGEMIRQRLDLDDEQARRLEDVVAGFHEDRSRLMREEQALRRQVQEVLLQGGEDPAEARRLLDRMHELRLEEARLWRAEEERLLQVLTPTQVLRFQALREEMGRRIQRLRGGGPPGPPGMGPPVGTLRLDQGLR